MEERRVRCRIRMKSENLIRITMIIQAYMGCTLYETIVHGDVSFPVNFDKTVEFGIYGSGGG